MHPDIGSGVRTKAFLHKAHTKDEKMVIEEDRLAQKENSSTESCPALSRI